MNHMRLSFRALALVATLWCGALSPPLFAQTEAAEIPGERLAPTPSASESTADIMLRQSLTPTRFAPRVKVEREMEVERAPNPKALNVPYWPYKGGTSPLAAPAPYAPQTAALTFDGATLADTSAFPPDTMGTVGPTQWVTFVNGRIRTFTKAGVADGVINADPDVFFASVMTPVSGSVVLNFTSDPQVRYDRFTARWFMSIIDVPCTNAQCTATAANRWLLAVSNTSTITAATTWKFFFVPADAANFCDYPSLGVDVNALYFGCNMFTGAGAFAGTNAYVVQKSSVLGAGPIVATKFSVGTTSAGTYTPRGVDNFDPAATVGYFVGVDMAVFSQINFRRVSNPGSAAPTISADLIVTVPTTVYSNPVEHTGNTGGTNGNLDALDDRLFAATLRNGHLWTAHNIRVTSAGAASTTTQARNAARWYDFTVANTGTPTLNQSGTVYDNATNRSAAHQYWIPTITPSGQGHAVIGFTQAGNTGATPAFTGRLASDAAGSMSGVPGTGVVASGVTTANYNPPSDPGGGSGRRWGDYSFTVVDPLDDMTIWTTQEYNQGLNSYAARVTKLLAPPPATPTCSATPINFVTGTGNVVINATSASGSGFYDPGANLPAPALAFTHISASVSGGVTVNSITYNSPTQVTLNITANTAGSRNVTITNPDGQSVTANGCINVVLPTYTIGGTITGLSGSVSLKLDGTSPTSTQTQSFGTNGSFTFSTALQQGSNWTVSVATQPVGQTCNLTGASGTNLAANVTSVQVNCTTNQYTLTYTAGANGSISGTSPQTVSHGGSGTAVTAVPNTGYHFVQWSDASTANPRTDSNVTGNISVTATFAINQYTLTYTAGANGSISGTSPQTVDHGSSGTAVTAVPATGYHFVKWSDDSTANPRTDANVTGTISVTATFAINQYTLTYTAGANGSISGTSPQTVDHGSSGSAVTAVPAVGYHFVQWSDASTANPRTDSNVTGNISVTATFAINQYTLTYTAGANGSISGTSPQTVDHGSSGTAVTAVPNTGYHFVQWSDASTANPRTDSNVTGNISVTATFAINQYTLTYTAGANGSISGTSPQTVDHGSSGSAVTAVPAVGYHFVQWSDASTANPRTDSNVTGNISVTATFAINQYTLTYTAGANGSISGTSPQTVSHGGSGTAVTAVPNTGYHFVQWSDSSTANPRTDTNVTGNISVTASFAINPPDHLVFTQAPANVAQGNRLGAVIVSIVDIDGNVIASDSTSQITLAVAACGGPVTLEQMTVTNGVASFPANATQRFYTLATGKTLTATSASLTGNASFDIVTNADLVFADGFESCRL